MVYTKIFFKKNLVSFSSFHFHLATTSNATSSVFFRQVENSSKELNDSHKGFITVFNNNRVCLENKKTFYCLLINQLPLLVRQAKGFLSSQISFPALCFLSSPYLPHCWQGWGINCSGKVSLPHPRDAMIPIKFERHFWDKRSQKKHLSPISPCKNANYLGFFLSLSRKPSFLKSHSLRTSEVFMQRER